LPVNEKGRPVESTVGQAGIFPMPADQRWPGVVLGTGVRRGVLAVLAWLAEEAKPPDVGRKCAGRAYSSSVKGCSL